MGLLGWLRTLISIHALLAESDSKSDKATAFPLSFLSTLSLRRATNEIPYQGQIDQFLSTLSLRRATRADSLAHAPPKISIHALLAESDRRHRSDNGSPVHFYPRSPCGERRGVLSSCFAKIIFLSTLSLRRATIALLTPPTRKPDFYPRSPCGERRL